MKKPEIQRIPFRNIKVPENGTVAIIRDENPESIVETVNSEHIDAISINCSRGWTRQDCSFLSEIRNLKALDIMTGPLMGVNSIEAMPSLEDVHITAVTDEKINFGNLVNLKSCSLYWWPGASSIFNCFQLEELHLDEIRLDDYSVMSNLVNLKRLGIYNSDIKSLEWIGKLSNLEELDLSNCRRLERFDELAELPKLKKLIINGCAKLNNIDFVSKLSELEWLNISDNRSIKSLSPLKNLFNLKIFFFTGSTIIEDGNLSALETLPKLSVLNFNGKKQYSHKLAIKWGWENLDNPNVLFNLLTKK
ncbi:leucine-rich repeat domain-containing protein [Catenovulum sediminis]|uniref:Leucine-rich repeat domain-containing protein n=1 Tax=Catenovulum sediminis TaxID=1740262 RepID=A0ABV1RF35_9ALTE